MFTSANSIRIALLVVAASALAAGAEAAAQEGPPRAGRGGGAKQLSEPHPGFGQFPAGDLYGGRPAPVRLRTRRDRQFRTALREGAAAGPNFAGRYTVVHWGCGTGCAQVAVVDAKTGLVYWPPLRHVDIPYAEREHYGFGYRPDSRLLVLTRSRYDRESSYEAFFYVFERNRFRLVRRAERKQRPVETDDDPRHNDPHDPKEEDFTK